MKPYYKLSNGTTINKEDVLGIECKHAVYLKPQGFGKDDYHLVKEVFHLKDGTHVPNIRYRKNFIRPFWITKNSLRNHKQKKEYEYECNLIKYECKQSELVMKLARLLDMPHARTLQDVCSSPYVYGADISSTSLIKRSYFDHFGKFFTPNRVAMYDIETSVDDENYGEVLCISIALDNKAYLFATKRFLAGEKDVRKRLDEILKKVMTEYGVADRYTYEFHELEDEVEIIQNSFKLLHKLQPDVVAIWNINYDIPHIFSRLEKYNIDPSDVFCEPSTPKELRVCKYIEGPAKKTTSSNKEKPIPPALRWHKFRLSASFVMMDAMCVYKQVRLAKPEEQSYALDAIMLKELGKQKLKHQPTEHLQKAAWHLEMQRNHKLVYIAYNMIDTIGMALLDEKTNDLRISLSANSEFSDYESFNSKPKMIANAFYYNLRDKQCVLASSGKNIIAVEKDPDDEDDDGSEDEILNLRNWIATLKTYMLTDGLKISSDFPDHETGLRAFAQDCDMSAAYPSCIQVLNVSKETTAREVIDIKGIDERTFRLRNIDIISSDVNSYTYCKDMLGYPSYSELEKLF
jgi:hypothetical protein